MTVPSEGCPPTRPAVGGCPERAPRAADGTLPARNARSRRLAEAVHQQALTALGVSPGARAHDERRRASGATWHEALRALATRLVGVLHGCLRHHSRCDEATARPAEGQGTRLVG